MANNLGHILKWMKSVLYDWLLIFIAYLYCSFTTALSCLGPITDRARYNQVRYNRVCHNQVSHNQVSHSSQICHNRV